MPPFEPNNTYVIPNKGLPTVDIRYNLEDLLVLRGWLDSIGIKTANTRLERYIKYIQAVDSDSGQVRIFSYIDGDTFNDPIELHLHVLREIHELTWICGGFKLHMPRGSVPKLRSVVEGSDFAALDRDSSSRNTQFELRIASYFCRKGCEVDLSTDTDIVAFSTKETFHVECKRISGRSQLNRRLKEAQKQLENRMPRSTYKKHYGIVALDVTKLAFEDNGLTWALTSDHARDVLQYRLKEIKSTIFWLRARKDVVLTWLQIHIPSLVRYPPQLTTRFSNMYIVDDELGGRRLRAFNRLRAVLDAGKAGDPREEPAEELTMRQELTLPAGTVLRWDHELLRHFSEMQTLPEKDSDTIILSMITGDVTHDFYFGELELVCANLEEETKNSIKGNIEGTMAELLGRLLMYRFPYQNDHF